MIEVATFHGKQPKWLGYPILDGEILWVRFEGATEAEVIAKANAWYDNETVIGRHEIHSDEVSSKPYKDNSNWANPKGITKEITPSGLEGYNAAGGHWGDFSGVATPEHTHALSGSVWLINHSLKKKGRFPSAEVDAMLAQGWEKAGPRTAFKEETIW